MTMSLDEVNLAFAMLVEEIESSGDVIKEEISRQALAGDMASVRSLAEKHEKVADFAKRVGQVRFEWEAIFAPPESQAAHKRKNGNGERIGTRGPKTSLVVKFPSGRTLKEATAAETFCKTIEEMGIERVQELGKTMNNFPLVAHDRHGDYTQTKVGKYYVMTHNSTRAKKDLLEELGARLGFDLRVSIALEE
ncbi:hypothetical protein [Novosphingobium sp. MMS21-SN21R]|uniref:hypothetical protein n=1 Tax=Novosphingobium sp. MMS21-SN21R TaxID=2969298 RepID=UPI0028886D50|nr:hypothetical protein [Novosphingobium sp. MMS21-SN21R]MDT0506916.1 hypothetical protein [Novosphingobium sp. MMS21-SN21R]